MPYSIQITSYRKPGTTPTFFKSHFENVHIPLLKSVTGPLFPISHTRTYVQLDPESVPIVLVGTKEHFDYDVQATLVFEDEAAFGKFFAAVSEAGAAARLAEDEEKCLDRKRMRVVVLGETTVTGRE